MDETNAPSFESQLRTQLSECQLFVTDKKHISIVNLKLGKTQNQMNSSKTKTKQLEQILEAKLG